MTTQVERKELKPMIVSDEQGNLRAVRSPVMDLEGLITPTNLFYVVQHFPFQIL